MTAHADAEQTGVAVIGMAGRFPDAPDTGTLWRRLLDRTDCVNGTLVRADGVRTNRIGDQDTPAGFLHGFDEFDAGFFGISPLEADITDPQHRLLLECAWEALEDAGHGEPAGTRIGVFATASQSGYLWTNVRANSGVMAATDDTQLALANAPDFLASRISFKLDLTGPAMTVSAACSSASAAVHAAVRSLRSGECDLAVVGGASITVSPWCERDADGEPVPSARDDRCRPFNPDARGTVAGDVVAALVLRRLPEALEAGDTVRAVIRGTAMNNDGGHKMGFSTPAVDGQAAVVRDALAAAGVDPATVGYVEAHGSGTPLGDAIELTALREGYGPLPDGTRLVGSVKSNIGYPDGTAGLAGLVKTVLALQHELIPATLHTAPGMPSDGFTVVAEPTRWPRGEVPRRAGVNAYAMGGTNVHVVVEEAPLTVPAEPRADRPVVLTVSGRTPKAADRAAARLTAHLADLAENPADVAFTLNAGRRAFAHRRTLVVPAGCDLAEAASRTWSPTTARPDAPAAVAFAFTGADGPREDHLWAEPVYVAAVGQCAARLRDHHRIAEPTPAVAAFVHDHALALLLESWGATPRAVLGQGTGLAAAAVAAGFLDRDTALGLLVGGDHHDAPAPPRVPLLDAATGAPVPAEQLADLIRRAAADHDSTAAFRPAAVPGIDVVLHLGGREASEPQPGGPRVLPCGGDEGAVAALAALWTLGAPVDWQAFHGHHAPRRLPLPTYPFERRRHWVEPDTAPAAGTDQAAPDTAAQAREAEIARLLADDSRDPIEAVVAGVWQDVLGVERVGLDDDFFTLGGDSLRMLRVTSRLEDLFTVRIVPQDAFRARRLDLLLELLEDLVLQEAAEEATGA